MKLDMFTHLSIETFCPARSEIPKNIPFTHTMSGVSHPKRGKEGQYIFHFCPGWQNHYSRPFWRQLSVSFITIQSHFLFRLTSFKSTNGSSSQGIIYTRGCQSSVPRGNFTGPQNLEWNILTHLDK
ncbi:hypothetical protein TNCV_517681 [Trichonephila clavipes]|nr:hypothetical protein TNCV_517681 [Trichonephila clavipes]